MGVWDRMPAVSETGFFNDRGRNGESNGWALENRLTRTILDSSVTGYPDCQISTR